MNIGIRLHDAAAGALKARARAERLLNEAAGAGLIVFETERLSVRAFREDDLDAFAAYRNDAEWMRWQGFKGLDKAAYRAALLGAHPLTEGIQLAVVRREDGALLGDLYLRQEKDALWLGYTVAPAFARRGYASEAVSGALAWAEAGGFAIARAAVASENAPSVGLLRKLGFARVGRDEARDDVYERPSGGRG